MFSDGDDERPEWNLNSWWLKLLGQNWFDAQSALRSKEIDLILDSLELWLVNMTSKIKEADAEAFVKLEAQLDELNVLGARILDMGDGERDTDEGMCVESDFFRGAKNFYAEMVQIIDSSGLLRFKAPSKDLKTYLKKIKGGDKSEIN